MLEKRFAKPLQRITGKVTGTVCFETRKEPRFSAIAPGLAILEQAAPDKLRMNGNLAAARARL